MILRELVTKLSFGVDAGGIQKYEAMLDGVRAKAESATNAIGSALAGAAAISAAALGGLALAGRAVAVAGDAMVSSLAKIESSVGRSATSAAEAAGVYEQLHQVGLKTGVSADESAGAFVRFNLAMKDLQRPASDTVALIEGIQAAGIIAGTSTAELTGTMQQLGQALGSGKLQGDELKSMRESMPGFLREIVKELGTTSEQFFADAEKGLLTPAKLIPAMLKASQGARAELARFPLTMARSFAILQNSSTRFLADLDKALGLSRLLAGGMSIVSGWIEKWRAALPAVGAFVDSLGGLSRILGVVGYAIGITAAGLAVFNAGLLIGIARMALFMAPWVAAAAVVVGLALLLDDFVRWVQGNTAGTLFGSWFGGFDALVAPVRTALADLDAKMNAFVDGLGGAWARGVAGMRPQVDWIIGVGQSIVAAFQPMVAFFSGLFGPIIAQFNAFYERIQAVVNGIRSMIPGGGVAEGAGTGSNPAAQAEQRGRLGGRGALGGFYDPNVQLQNFNAGAAGRLGATGAASPISANQTINQQISVTATGVSAPEVAAGAQAGVNRGNVQGGGAFAPLARQLGVGNPRTEQPAT